MSRNSLEETGSLSKSEISKLNRFYRNGPAAYGSVKNLSKASGLSIKKVKAFLSTKASYTKYHPVNRKFRRLGAHASHKNHTWSMDLAFVDKLAQWNKNFKYLLVCVDNFSRFIRVEALKKKLASSTKQVFAKMLKKSGSQPKYLWVDQGTEFAGEFQSFCKNLNIKIYHTYSETKACYAERAIRSLKNLIYRHLEETNSNSYIQKLPKIVSTLNNRINRSTGKQPRLVKNSDALRILYGNPTVCQPKMKPKFRVGERVRISKLNTVFNKGYKPNFSNEVFTIEKVFKSNPASYHVRDENNEIIRGRFYEKELVLQKS